MYIDFRSISPIKAAKILGIFFVVGNILFLDLLTVHTVPIGSKTYISYVMPKSQNPVPDTTTNCASCPAQINQALTLIKNVQASLSVTPTPKKITIVTVTTPTSTPTPTPAQANGFLSSVKEYYVTFGVGSGQSSDWADVAGLQTYIDTTLYPPIKKVTFEITGRTPTGNQIVNARLYNGTDSTPVIGSDSSWSGGGSQFLVSIPITLANGNKLYKVQMKTQLQFLSYIDQAKVHIILY